MRAAYSPPPHSPPTPPPQVDRKTETGTASCRVCGEAYSRPISYLEDAVDVFASWTDALDKGQQGGGAAGGGGER